MQDASCCPSASICTATRYPLLSAIMNPVRPQDMEAVRGANVLNGTDKDCTNWIRTYKDYKPAEGGHPGRKTSTLTTLCTGVAMGSSAGTTWVGSCGRSEAFSM